MSIHEAVMAHVMFTPWLSNSYRFAGAARRPQVLTSVT